MWNKKHGTELLVYVEKQPCSQRSFLHVRLAHRVHTEADVRAISDTVSATTEQEAGFSDFVGPFAYRLACVGHGAQRSPRNLGNGNRGPEEDNSDGQEGYCDNGDVGSGEKLLHLLQKWDVRNRMLMVTRIDGGFMMAELMGVRR